MEQETGEEKPERCGLARPSGLHAGTLRVYSRSVSNSHHRLADEELLDRLVRFDTTSHKSNRELIEFVANYVDRPGVSIHRSSSADGTKANLLCRCGPEREDQAGLTLCGHTDVVPALEEGWRSEPFALRREDDRWVARGSCDMKGFLALAMRQFAAVDVASLQAPLALLFTYDEEVGSLGVQQLAEDPAYEQLPRALVIGEPTEMRVIRTHKGHLRLNITTDGRSAHSAFPDRGHNAIEPAAEVVRRLGDLRAQLAKERIPSSTDFPRVPFVAMNIATIRGGTAVNVIPDRCEIELGIRLLPGVNTDELIGRVREAVVEAIGDSGWQLSLGNLSPALEPAGDPFEASVCRHAGLERAVSADFSSDGGTLSQLGFDCVLFGPGSIEVAHRPNEFLPIDQFEAARGIVEQLVHTHCREPLAG